MCRHFHIHVHVYTSTEYDSPYFLRKLKVNSYSFKETTRLNLNLHAPFMNLVETYTDIRKITDCTR